MLESYAAAMYNRFTDEHKFEVLQQRDLESDTARWTSPAFDVSFGRVSEIDAGQHDHESFRISSWGLSVGLCDLLADYTDEMISNSLNWLVIRQNAHVVVMLDHAMNNLGSDFNYEMLDQVFIAIDAELFLPRGLRMHVTCITNIVQVSADSHMLDKFVAVVDPGEAEKYVRERRGTSLGGNSNKIH